MKKVRGGEAWPTLEQSGAIAAPNCSLPTEAPARAYPSSRKQVRALAAGSMTSSDANDRKQQHLELLTGCLGMHTYSVMHHMYDRHVHRYPEDAWAVGGNEESTSPFLASVRRMLPAKLECCVRGEQQRGHLPS